MQKNLNDSWWPSGLSSLRHHGYRVFIAGQALSLLGTWVQGTAQRWLVLELTGSAFYVGVLGAVAGLPILFFSLLGGFLADRFPKINFLIFVHSIILAQALIFGLLIQTGQINFSWILLLALVLGIGTSFEVPARQSLVFDLVGKDDITNGIAIHSTAFNLARFAGPAIAGILIKAGWMQGCFYLKAASAFLIMLVLFYLRKIYPRFNMPIADGKDEQQPFGAIKKTIVFVSSRKELAGILMTIVSFGVLLLPYSILLPSFGRDVLGLDARGYGFISAANGFGALAGALFVAVFGHSGNRKKWWRFGAFAFPLTLTLFSFSISFIQATITLFLSGFIMVITSTSAISILQIEATNALRGRLMGLFTTSFMGLFPLGSLIQGALADLVGIKPTLLTMSLVALTISFALWKNRFYG